MGSNFDSPGARINQAFAAGQIGMYTGGSDLYTALVQNNSLNPDDYGVTIIPLDGLADRRRARRRDAGGRQRRDPSEAERDAAVHWIDFYYMQKLLTQDAAVADAQTLKADNQPVGVPALPIFDQATYEHRRSGSRTTSTSRREQMTPFTSKIFDQPIVTEPRPHPGDLRDPRPRRAGRAHRRERRHRRAARVRPTSRSRPSSTPAEHRSACGPRRRRGPSRSAGTGRASVAGHS